MKPIDIRIIDGISQTGHIATDNGNEGQNFRFQLALRGDNKSRCCLNSGYGIWGKIEFPTPTAFNSVILTWSQYNNSGNYEFALQGSNDDISYTDIVSKATYTFPGSGSQTIISNMSSTDKYKYLRLYKYNGTYLDLTNVRVWEAHSDITISPIKKALQYGDMHGNWTNAIISDEYFSTVIADSTVRVFNISDILNSTNAVITPKRSITLPDNRTKLGTNENNTKLYASGENKSIVRIDPTNGAILETLQYVADNLSQYGSFSVNESLGIVAFTTYGNQIIIKKISDGSTLATKSFISDQYANDISLSGLGVGNSLGITFSNSRIFAITYMEGTTPRKSNIWMSEPITLDNLTTFKLEPMDLGVNPLSLQYLNGIAIKGLNLFVHSHGSEVGIYSFINTSIKKILFTNGTNAYNWLNSSFNLIGTTPLTENMFINQGNDFYDIQTIFNKLNINSIAPNLDIKMYTLKPTGNCSVIPSINPKKYIIKSKLISLADVEHIDNLILTGTNIKLFISNDNITWHTYKNSSWNPYTLNSDNLNLNGMTISEFNNIPNSDLNTFLNTGKMYFACILDSTSSNLDNIELQADLKGQWYKSGHLTEYQFGLINENIKLNIFVPGSYKINY